MARLWDHADELTEMALKAPVATMPGALAMLRLLRKHPLEREVEVWQEFYPAAMDRALAVIEAQARPATAASRASLRIRSDRASRAAVLVRKRPFSMARGGRRNVTHELKTVLTQ